jgi:hypothetical protein
LTEEKVPECSQTLSIKCEARKGSLVRAPRANTHVCKDATVRKAHNGEVDLRGDQFTRWICSRF